ncbi:hypothetical protein TWF694_010081 [Orbilia ellipsospora]|uniref:F-box domain-containing protein n=1 Tax=Orbilia ellipsospora TaxID=2528407 RepID=A0AAV9XBF6_9PEZI
MEAPKLTITSLPVEVQTEILSYLPINAQVFASLACRSWEAILTTTPSFTAVRYGDFQSLKLAEHFLLRQYCNLVCKVKNGRILGASISSEALVLPYGKVSFYDISSSKILDDVAIKTQNGLSTSQFLEICIVCYYHMVTHRTESRWLEEATSDMTLRGLLTLAARYTRRAIEEFEEKSKYYVHNGYQYDKESEYQVKIALRKSYAGYKDGELWVSVYLDHRAVEDCHAFV